VLDVPHDNHRETCAALGFLDDNNEWDLFMTESRVYDIYSKTRATFVILLVCNEVGHPSGLFNKHLRAMGVDFVHVLNSEEHPISDGHLMILVLVLVDINRASKQSIEMDTETEERNTSQCNASRQTRMQATRKQATRATNSDHDWLLMTTPE
jgi:hypothetical protein